MNYFQVIDDVRVLNRWFLKSAHDLHGNLLNPELFRVGQPLELSAPLTISIRREGNPLGWTFADFELPVLSEVAANSVRAVCPEGIQFLDARVENDEGCYSVLNVLNVRAAVDESRSEFLKWTDADNRPDKAGQYRQVSRLRIDVGAILDLHIFRLHGWKIALIVSEVIKANLQQNHVTGVRFLPVN